MKNHFLFISSLRFINFLFCVTLSKVCGTKILWTIHNVASHDRPGTFFETLVTKLLLIIADKVTALNEHIKNSVSARYGFKDIELMRQGLYENCYANTVTREQARQHLGLNEKDFVLLFFGGVAEYKGIDIAIEALDLVADDSVKILIAGRLGRTSTYGARLVKLGEKNKNVFIFDKFIPDDEVQTYFKAADYTIYPYRRIDNSGPLYLTLTFGVPTIIRGAGGIPEILKLNPNVAIVIDRADKNDIAQAIEKARTRKIESTEFAVFNEALSWRTLEHEIINCFNKLQD
jgi:glycosyltransferase involved in cell wall biosynthesis